jgi:diacylglycerol kinase family enzyme
MKEIISNLSLIIQSATWLNNYKVLLLLNPLAGGFTNRRIKNKNIKSLHKVWQFYKINGTNNALIETFSVQNKGEATTFLNNYANQNMGSTSFVISLGGDGFTGEVLTALDKQPDLFKEHLVFLATPMGTGNDGSSSATLAESAYLIAEGPTQGRLTPAKLIKVQAKNKPLYTAYNVSSLGIDAFIAHITDKIKHYLPGNSYKLMVDIGALFYDAFFKVGNSEVDALLTNGKHHYFKRKLLLFCVGYEGGARYGGGKTVIPGNENVCALSYMNVWKRIIYRQKIARGEHRHLAETDLFSANSISYNYSGKILLNIDGEIELLEASNFPVTFTLITTSVKVLKAV